MRVPNVLLWLLQALAWVYWRPPMATQTKPKREPRPPRRPTLCITTAPTPHGIHSVVRTSWFRNGRMVEVDEVQIPECEDVEQAFQYFVGNALQRGCDVSVMTSYTAQDLRIPF